MPEGTPPNEGLLCVISMDCAPFREGSALKQTLSRGTWLRNRPQSGDLRQSADDTARRVGGDDAAGARYQRYLPDLKCRLRATKSFLPVIFATVLCP